MSKVQLFTEEELKAYVEYWGGDLQTLIKPDYKRGRALAAVTFYALHHPDQMPERMYWQHTIHQAVTFLWDWLKVYKHTNDQMFRTPECKAYFQQLFDGYLETYGKKAVYQFRFQNWYVVDCPTMIDQLWTVQEALKDQK